MKNLLILIFALAIAFSQETIDDTTPTSKELKKVYDYLKMGSKGAILYDSRVTSHVTNFLPVDTLKDVALDSTVFVWMNFILPANFVDETFTIQIKKGPVPSFVQQLKLATKNNIEILDYRISRNFLPKFPGKYSVQLFKNDIIVAEHIFYVKEGKN